MELIPRHVKKIMEECKTRARKAGLQFYGDTIEYIVTNRDLLELSPKLMIPTLYDYWIHDVEVVRNKWIYDAYPHNPYETVINTRPAISFYNDNNPDWLNVMIFYHVLAHIDCFQNNVFFRETWNDDFCGQALADKRLLNKIRMELGAEKRWVDYVIEFARSVDNLVGYYSELRARDQQDMTDIFSGFSPKVRFYFGTFLKQLYSEKRISLNFYYKEERRYNQCMEKFGDKEKAEAEFFADDVFSKKFPEFESLFKKHQEKKGKKPKASDILQHLLLHSDFLNKEENKWMKDVISVVRKTSLFFQPQIRTKILHEGWASYWHEKLFLEDERINRHEVDFSVVNAGVLVDPRVGFNPYSIGKHLLEFIEHLASKGKLSREFQALRDIEKRKAYDAKLGPDAGRKFLFWVRTNFDDSMLVNFLSDEDFQDFVDKYKLFVTGVRLSEKKFGYGEVYIKSRSGKDFRKMINNHLYHPPYIRIAEDKAAEGELYLDHVYEGRSLVTRYIPAVLSGLAYLWHGKVILETTEFEKEPLNYYQMFFRRDDYKREYKKVRVKYSHDGKDLKREVLFEESHDEEKQEDE